MKVDHANQRIRVMWEIQVNSSSALIQPKDNIQHEIINELKWQANRFLHQPFGGKTDEETTVAAMVQMWCLKHPVRWSLTIPPACMKA
jgi:hypothetical protein